MNARIRSVLEDGSNTNVEQLRVAVRCIRSTIVHDHAIQSLKHLDAFKV